MANVKAVVGMQIGDEAKGKVVDYLADELECGSVVRCQGGQNAGHTLVIKPNGQDEYVELKLHAVPSGIANPRLCNIVGPGTVVHLGKLVDEIELLRGKGLPTDSIVISSRAHIVMPYHIALDGIGTEAKIGTTKQGIGPCYGDRALRKGFQVGELRSLETFRKKLGEVLEEKNLLLTHYGLEPMTVGQIMLEIEPAAEYLLSHVRNTDDLIWDTIEMGYPVILEAQLGGLKGITMGMYPFVTGSDPTAGGLCAGAGIPPTCIDQVIGVMKAYVTNVGAGPFPTRMDKDIEARVREVGHEKGATTGRERDCGWLDIPALKWVARQNGTTDLVVAKIDVLTGISPIKICTGYELDGHMIEYFPETDELDRVVPIYEEMPGWTKDIRSAKWISELPVNATNYLDRIRELVGVPIKYLSTGPEREAMIEL